MNDTKPLDLAFVSDVACPWCAIGLASLDRALASLGNDVPWRLRYEPFELNPDMGSEGAETTAYLMKKYGRTAEQIAQAQARIREHGANVGFTFGPRPHVWNTFDAHRLLHWASLEGKAAAVKRALLQAYHGEGRNPASKEVLLEAATAAGLDIARAGEILAGDAYASDVRAREALWRERGVNGVPLLIVNDKYALEGAQPPEAYAQALRQIAAEG